MKYCVLHNVRFEVPAKRDSFDTVVGVKIAGKPTWGETLVHKGTDKENYPFHRLVIRFQNSTDMDELFDFIKDKLDTIPAFKGTVSKHNCPHDEGTVQPCTITEEYIKG